VEYLAACLRGDRAGDGLEDVAAVLRDAGASDAGSIADGSWWRYQVRFQDRLLRIGTLEDFLAKARIGEGAAPSDLQRDVGQNPDCDVIVLSSEP
jgi:hypothetical protein